MRVEEALRDLLHHQNKIALSGFGYFNAEYASAYIHPSQHLFQPPHRKINFLLDTSANDDILTNYLIDTAKIKKSEAEKQMAQFIADIRAGLTASNKYSIDGIGEWYYDIEKVLQFRADESVNYLKNAYGLPPFVGDLITRKAQPIAKSETAVPIKKTAIPPAVPKTKSVPKANLEPIASKKPDLNTIAYLALGVVVLGIIVVIVLDKLHIIKI